VAEGGGDFFERRDSELAIGVEKAGKKIIETFGGKIGSIFGGSVKISVAF